jgi:hypothetical protein
MNWRYTIPTGPPLGIEYTRVLAILGKSPIILNAKPNTSKAVNSLLSSALYPNDASKVSSRPRSESIFVSSEAYRGKPSRGGLAGGAFCSMLSFIFDPIDGSTKAFGRFPTFIFPELHESGCPIIVR